MSVIWNNVYSELTRGYLLEQDEAKYTERRKRVYNVFKIPIELEKVVIGYGKLYLYYGNSLKFAAFYSLLLVYFLRIFSMLGCIFIRFYVFAAAMLHCVF